MKTSMIAILLVCGIGSALSLKCYTCIHTTVTADDEELNRALQKSISFDDNEISCMLGADTFEDNKPEEEECSWDVLHRQVLLSVRAGELKVDTDKDPLEVSYPGNREEEYEFRCQKQKVSVRWIFPDFAISVVVRSRGCQAVHIAERIPNTCTYDMESWMGEKFETAVKETHHEYELDGELCFCEGKLCNSAVQTKGTFSLALSLLFLAILTSMRS